MILKWNNVHMTVNSVHKHSMHKQIKRWNADYIIYDSMHRLCSFTSKELHNICKTFVFGPTRKFWDLKLAVCFYSIMTSYMSKEQGKFYFSIHDSFYWFLMSNASVLSCLFLFWFMSFIMSCLLIWSFFLFIDQSCSLFPVPHLPHSCLDCVQVFLVCIISSVAYS